MKEIKTSCGKSFIVDDEDYPLLSRHNFYVNKDGYVLSTSFRKMVQELIIHKEPQNKILFLNKNTLDLRKENLKEVNRSVPLHYTNKSQRRNYTSRYKGVCWVKNDKRWLAQVSRDGIKYNKYFKTEEEAALFYNEKAIELYGPLAYQNKVI